MDVGEDWGDGGGLVGGRLGRGTKRAGVCCAHAGKVDVVFDQPAVMAGAVHAVFVIRGGRRGAIEDLAHPEFFGEPVLPAGFSPPAHDVLTDAVEGFIAHDQVKDPIRKDINMSVAMGSQHADAAVLVDEAVSDREVFLLPGDVAQGVGGGGVEEFGDVRSQRTFAGRNPRLRERGSDDEVRLGAFDATFGFSLIPDTDAAPASALFTAQTHLGAVIVEGIGCGSSEAGFLDHPCF